MKIWQTIVRRKALSITVAVVVIVGGVWIYRSTHATSAVTQYVTSAVERGTLSSSVSGSGQVSAENQLDIKPSGSAAVTEVDVKLGQVVKAGQRIAVLDEKDASVALAQAQASLDSAQANYDSVAAGSTATDLQLAQSAVDSAQLSLTKAKNDYQTTKQQQAQAVANASLNLLNASLQAQPQPSNIGTTTVTVSGSYTGTDKGQYIITIYTTGNGSNYNVAGLESSSFGPIVKGVAEPVGTKGLYITFATTGVLINGDSWTITLPNTQGSGYASANNSYQSAILAQQQAMNNAQNSIDSAQISLTNAQAQLQLKQNGSTQSQIEQAKAQLANAKSQLQSAQNNYNNNIITAPFDGVIASLNAKVGQQVSGSTSAAGSTALATLITQQKIVIISLNEVDVTKIKVGDKVTLTFDAIDGLVITGTVGEIDSIGTVSQGVVNYNVQISLDTSDDRIKPGMSATANIITNVKTDVLMVPNSAIKSGSSGSYVQELDSAGKPQNVTVTTGIANDTSTEIVSGLNEGDKVVTQTISVSAAASTQSASSALRIPGLTGGGIGGGGAARTVGGAARGN
jgi:HlyD family secretion protein